jgi:cupin 2 domain-containing protein
MAQNIFTAIPPVLQKELIETLAESGAVRIERIISEGQATPPGEWYDQNWNEWVLLITGGATLLFDSDTAPLDLNPGDYLVIPAGCRHRVERTAPDQKTIWLAIHFGEGRSE